MPALGHGFCEKIMNDSVALITKVIANFKVVDNWWKDGLVRGQTVLYLSHFLNMGTMVGIIGVFLRVVLCNYATARRASRTWRF